MNKLAVRNGFSLIELLVVIGIIGLLAALLFPVFRAAKRSAFSTESFSNMRQAWLATKLYMEDYSTESAPAQANVSKIIPPAIACSHLDNWHSPCSVSDSNQWMATPFIGSYAYFPTVANGHPNWVDDRWEWMAGQCTIQPLFIDPFGGDAPANCPWYYGELDAQYIAYSRRCIDKYGQRGEINLPNRISFIDMDGSSKKFSGAGAIHSWDAVDGRLINWRYCTFQ